MTQRPEDLKQPQLPESAQIWDNSDHEWVTAYRKDFKRLKTVKFLDNILFDATAETFTAKEFECAAYSTGLLKINLDVTGTPTDIYFVIQFSDNLIDWYNYVRGPFGDFRYEDSAGDKKECIDFPILDKYMRIYAVSSGCSGSATFLMNVSVTFSG